MSTNCSRLFIASLLALLAILLAVSAVLSAPVPPKLVVNHNSRECGEIFGGDECMDCMPAEGWEVLGYAIDEGVECPEGYSWVDPPYTCHGFKDQFCCSKNHSGAPGNCEDMVISRLRRSCAFVEDVDQCVLPLGWKTRPETSNSALWLCPSGYTWTDEVMCETGDARSGSVLSLIVLVLLIMVVVLIVAVVVITLMIRGLRAR